MDDRGEVFVGDREEPDLRLPGAVVAIWLNEGCLEGLNEAGRPLVKLSWFLLGVCKRSPHRPGDKRADFMKRLRTAR